MIVSQGSSGSDRPFVEAAATILAAFRPETKARLAEERLVAPTLQYVLRRSLRHVRDREAYMSGAAHPPVFEAGALNLARAVALAQGIEPDALPPEVRLAVVEEELGREGIDFFGAGLGEVLFDAPAAIARLWRSRAGRRTMVVSAEGSRDANGRPLAFRWRLLQGDPERVRIEPLDGGARARITLDWHDRFPLTAAGGQATARVDVGVFASNGVHDSAPAIVSWHFPRHETRRYEPGPDGAPRIVEIDGADPEKAEVYADPLLWPRAAWRDVHRYDADGRHAGWTRQAGGRTDRYDAEGRRILDGDRREAVAYLPARRPDGAMAVEEVSAGPPGRGPAGGGP
jgi:hypothetical protein